MIGNLFKGTVYTTTDPNLCLANLNTCKTIAIVDEPDSLNIPGKIGGSILLPPYEALAYLVEDKYNEFEYEYTNYLINDVTANKFIDIILEALIAGTNIILYVEKDAPNFINTLRAFFEFNFGILIGNEMIQFATIPSYEPKILSRLYDNDSCDKEYFLKLYPEGVNFDQFTLGKLCYEYNVQFPNQNDAEIHFMKLSKILKNGGLIRNVVQRIG